jgi:hypothetical protein
MVISPQKIVNNLIRRVPENRRLILDAVVPFKIIESSDFSIEGLELRGNSQLSKRFDVNLESGNSAIRTTASSNYILRDLETHHFNNDGVYIGNGSNSNPSQFIADNNVRIHNVRSHHNTRIAMMFAQARHVHVSSSTMEKSGLNGDDDTANEDYPGLPPMAGVDVEPNTVPLTVTFGTGAQARTYQAEKVNNPDFPDQLLVSLRKNSGNVNMKPVDKMTGHISFENCLFSGNVGRMFQSSLKDENTVPLTEDIAIRHSIFRSSGRETAVTFGLITRNGVVQFNDLELGPGSLSWAHNLGSALHITNQNEHASLIFTNNYLSSSSFITNEWGRQPLVVSNNIFESIHPNNFLAKLARPQDFAFIRVSQNPKAIFHRNTLILSPGLLPATNSSGGPVFQFQFFGRLASENQYQSSSPLPQGDTRKFLISYGRSTSPKRRAEYRNENFSPEFAPQFSPNGDCLWDSTQVTTPTALELPKTWLCRTPPLDQSITTILEYKPYLPDSIE